MQPAGAVTLGGCKAKYPVRLLQCPVHTVLSAVPELRKTGADLSGIDAPYETETDTELGWCQAKLLYTDGGAGKILWYDVAPGVLYSLSMDTGASEEALQDMALALYTPLQDDVG